MEPNDSMTLGEMSHHTEQFVGALFRVLSEGGYTDARAALLDAYRSESDANREALTENLLTDVIPILQRYLGTGERRDVLSEAIERVLTRFSTVVETVPVTVLVVDSAGRIDLWNDGAERMFGWTEDKARGRPYHELLESAPSDSVLEELSERGPLGGIETRYTSKDGSVLDVRVWAAPLRGQDGAFEGAIIIVSDITAQKQREQRLTVLNRVLRHNIQNNVTVIRNNLELLVADVADGNERVRVIEDYLDDTMALSRTARQLEQLRETDSKEPSVIDLGPVVQNRLERFRMAYPDAEIFAAVPESTTVVAHDLFPHALDNVLTNALEHNDSDQPRVAVDVTEEDASRSQKKIEISDNGPGLPETERDVLTAETETQLTHSDGTGLWLTRWVVRSSNGTLTAGRSQLGGAKITISLPSATARS